MKPIHSKKRDTIFTLLWLVTVPGNLLCAALNYVIWSGGKAGDEWYQALLESASGIYVAAGAAALFGIVMTVATYLFSLDPHRRARPLFRQSTLVFSFGCFLAAYVLGQAGVAVIPAAIAAAAFAIALVFLVFALEGFFGRMLLNGAEKAYGPDSHKRALFLARLGLAFHPISRKGQKVYGLAQAKAGRGVRALPYLEDAYEREERSSELLAALADAYEATDKARAADLVEQLYAKEPNKKLLSRLVALWSATGQEDKVLATLQKLPTAEQREWHTTIEDMLFARNDIQALRDICHGYEQDGPPFTRARDCYNRILQVVPGDPSALEALTQISRRTGSNAQAAELMEQLLQQKPDHHEHRRWLIEYYSREDTANPERAAAHVQALVASGAATAEEKLQVLERHFDHGDYRAAQQFLARNEDLQKNSHAQWLVARTYFEEGKIEEAQRHIALGRLAVPGDETDKNFLSLEKQINDYVLIAELKDLRSRVEQNPDDLDLKFQYLDRLVADEQEDRVVLDLEELLAKKPELRDRIVQEIDRMLATHGRNFRLLSYLADIYLRDQNWDKVHGLYLEMSRESLHPDQILHEGATKILRENPGHCLSLLTMARHAYHAGHYENALDYLSRYYDSCGERTEQLMELEFDAASHLGDSDRAIAVGQELLKTQSDNPGLLVRMAEFMGKSGQYAQAVEYLARAKPLDPENHKIRLAMKDFDEKRKRARIAEIIELLKTTNSADLSDELGDLYHDFGQLNEAIGAYQRAAQSDKNHNVAKAKQAYVLARKGLYPDAEEALSDLELKVDQPPEEQDKLKKLLYSSAQLMEDDRQEERAVNIYRRIFRVDAGFKDVLTRIERLQRLSKQKRK